MTTGVDESITAFLNLDKPSGLTSFQCGKKVRRILGIKKTGHLGTLDPAARGVLPLALGRATRLIEYVPSDPKVYQGEFLLGVTTDTDDLEGRVLESVEVDPLPVRRIEEELKKFEGRILQTPPSVSAIKIQGKRAYKLARQGEDVQIPPRQVVIHSIQILQYDFPVVLVEIESGPGVYIRSIARDLGNTLGCGGCLKSLIRKRSGEFHLADAVTLEQLEEAKAQDSWQDLLVSPLRVIGNMRRAVLTDEGIALFKDGRPITAEHFQESPCFMDSDEAAGLNKNHILILDAQGNLLGVAAEGEENEILPEKVLCPRC